MHGYLRCVAIVTLTALFGIWSPSIRAQTSADVEALNQQVVRLFQAGRYAEAATMAERAVTLAERQFGPGHPAVGTALSNLANVYNAQGRYGDAEPLFKRALAIAEKTPNDPALGIRLNNLGGLYKLQGRYAEAEPLYKRALVVIEKAAGPDHPDVGTALNNLGQLFVAEERYAEAEPLAKRALAIAEKALGPKHPIVATRLSNLAGIYSDRGRYREAEPLLQRALAISETVQGPEHPDVASELRNLALLYQSEGRYDEAEPLMRRALTINEKVLGPEHPDVGKSLNDLAALYDFEGRYVEAEPLVKRALVISEKTLGPNHPTVGVRLTNLARLYRKQGRYADAEPLIERALAIGEKTPFQPNLAVPLNDLAQLYRSQGRYAEAEAPMKRALAILEKAHGGDHADVGSALNNLAGLYRDQGRYREAETLMRRALAITEKALGANHPTVGTDLNNLALLYDVQGRHAEAEPLMKRALAIDEKALGPDHPDVGIDYSNLATLYFSQGDWERAANAWRASTNIAIRSARRGARMTGQASAGVPKSEAGQHNEQFWGLVKAVNRLPAERGNGLSREAFQTAQWVRSSEAAQSLAQMAARGARGDAKLAALVRERQDLVAEWQKRDATQSASVAQPPEKRDAQAEATNNSRLAAIDRRIADIDKRLAADFPDYAALASPAPLSIEAVQTQLGPDEALVLFLDTPEAEPTPEETFIWVVTKTDTRWVRSALGTTALAREVGALRCGLDFDGAWIGTRCNELLKTIYGPRDYGRGKPLPFDLARAHALYQALFGQTEDLLKDKRLLIVPSGALTQLPFQVLVTAPPRSAVPVSVADYRDVAWLVASHAITILPAVSSLRSLRELARQSHANDIFIGFGDPLLDGDPVKFPEAAERAKLAREKSCTPAPRDHVASVSALRGGPRVIQVEPSAFSDVAMIRHQIALPETADELCEVALDLGVDPTSHVYLGANATETTIKRLSADGALAQHKIVHFATHGALAGQLSSKAEPGLLLTPPEKPSDIDDGYLSASEVAALKLDADWVILSACNTAAGEAKDADALSGLARAFFYAGARSLLVSHWSVASDSTVKLIGQAVAALRADPKIGRAEALRRSMLSLLRTGQDAEAHPSFWAPFVLVGEGAATR